jgi:hypothetical protein
MVAAIIITNPLKYSRVTATGTIDDTKTGTET